MTIPPPRPKEGRPDGAASPSAFSSTLAPVVPHRCLVLLAVVLAVLLAVKLPLLDLPFCWDEAWVARACGTHAGAGRPLPSARALPPGTWTWPSPAVPCHWAWWACSSGDTPVVLHAAALGLSLVLLITRSSWWCAPGLVPVRRSWQLTAWRSTGVHGTERPGASGGDAVPLHRARRGACRSGRHGRSLWRSPGAVLTRRAGLRWRRP